MKILEFKNLDWMKGISAQANVPVGGLFQYIQGCDPFETGGLASPSLAPAIQALGTSPKFISGFNNAGVSTLNVLSDAKLYQVLKNSPYTVTDKTSEIDQHLTFGTPTSHIGFIIYKGMYVYATVSSTNNGYISANTLPVVLGNDVLLKDNFLIRDTMRFCIGADGNLYYTYGLGKIGELTSVTGTSGNTTTFNIDTGFTPRDVISDGRYLVILADNNSSALSDLADGDFQSKIYFWDMVQTDANSRIVADAIWDLKDPYLIGGRFLEGGIYFFGKNGLYVCSIATSPKLIRPYPLTVNAGIYGRPGNAYQMTVSKGSVYWIDGTDTVNGYVYAYGNPTTGQQKIFYIPYVQTGSIYLNTCIASSGGQFVVGTAQTALNFYNTGSTRGRVVVKSLDTNMSQPHRYDYTKVVLSRKLQSGETVQLIATNGQNETISSETKSYNSANPKQQLKFTKIPGVDSPDKFEDIQITVNSSAPLQRVTSYATPIDDANEDI